MNRILSSILASSMVAGLYSAQSLRAQIVFTVEGPGVQATSVAGAITENFDSFSTGHLPASQSTPIGTFSGNTTAGAIVAANEFGGAGGVGKYYAVGGQSGSTTATLTFSSPQDYFGMWWSAGDAENVLKFYSGGTLLKTYNVAAISADLPGSYFGNPTANFLHEDSGEPFVYLNFTGVSGQTFTSVEFDNTLSTGFEMDDLSIFGQPITPPGNTIPDATNTGLLLLMMVAALTGYRQTGWCRA
jgi:hypothetical protein